MSVTFNEQVSEVVEYLLGAHRRDFLPLHQATQYLRHFNVEQMRSVKPF